MLPTTPARMTHDYVRHGTTSLFPALDIASGSVIAQHYRRHRHQEFLRFLKLIDAAVPLTVRFLRGRAPGLTSVPIFPITCPGFQADPDCGPVPDVRLKPVGSGVLVLGASGPCGRAARMMQLTGCPALELPRQLLHPPGR
jgi:hypothetical protein